MKGKIPWLRRKPGPRDFPYLPTVRDRLAQMPLVDATALATGWQLAVLGNANHAGRPALRVRATRLDASAPFGLWQYVDDYEVLVDETYGVLLRCAAVVGGEEAAVLSVQVAQFNEPIPDDIFAFEPPVGTRVLTQG